MFQDCKNRSRRLPTCSCVRNSPRCKASSPSLTASMKRASSSVSLAAAPSRLRFGVGDSSSMASPSMPLAGLGGLRFRQPLLHLRVVGIHRKDPLIFGDGVVVAGGLYQSDGQ